LRIPVSVPDIAKLSGENISKSRMLARTHGSHRCIFPAPSKASAGGVVVPEFQLPTIPSRVPINA
jgi:hypothetical protein